MEANTQLSAANEILIKEYAECFSDKDFPCVAGRASIQKGMARYMVADHLACPKDDLEILQFIYSFVEEYRQQPGGYYSASIIFKQPEALTELEFDNLLWARLQALADLDASQYPYDERVSADPKSPDFCFSLKQEAFFIIGIHAGSSRASRRFRCPVLVFNPHSQFEKLRNTDSYEKMQAIIRNRDLQYSGSVNPMLSDFATGLEVNQYSGRRYDNNWECPLKIKHAATKHNSTP